jgi:D-alanyl-D-alanine carboxypeptidase
MIWKEGLAFGLVALLNGLSVVSCGTSNGSDTGAHSSECQTLDQKLQQALDSSRKLSRDASLTVVTPACGQKLYLSGDTPITADKLFRIGSVTKTYVASVILKQLAAGKLALDNTADQYVDGVPNGNQITLRMLLQHTSGLFNYVNDTAFLSDLHKARTPGELVAIAASHPVDFAPGASWEYSNTNFIVLGMIAEKVVGVGIAQQIRETLLTPNGLSNTFFDGQEAVAGALAPGFDASNNEVTSIADPSAWWTAGAIVATSQDTANWIRFLGSGKIHDPPIQMQMESGVATAPGSGESYGLGLDILDASVTAGAGQGLGHMGGLPGYTTRAYYFPDTQLTLVVMVDQDGDDPADLQFAACNAMFN